MDGPGRQLAAQAEAAREHPRVAAGYATLIRQLCDLGDGRIAAMDAAGIDVQVLSLTSPGVEQLDATDAGTLARAINDRLADAVRRHPGRLAGFAALPTAAPEAAAEELERTVRDHGLKGAFNGHTGVATWTTSASGRSWSAPRRSGSRSTCIPHRRRQRRSRRCTPGTTHRR
jgi:uncharacterized protein